MKDSDLKKENLKKGAIVSGIAVGAAGVTAGTAYAATQAFGDKEDVDIDEVPVVETDVDVDYQDDEELDDEEILVTPQPAYTVTSSSASAPASAPVADAADVPLFAGETDPELSEIVLVDDDMADVDFSFVADVTTDQIVGMAEQSVPVSGALTDAYFASDESHSDLAEMYAGAAEQDAGVDMIDDLDGMPDPEMPSIEDFDFHADDLI